MKRRARSMGRVVFVRTMVSFLVFWAVMMGVIANLNYQRNKRDVEQAISDAQMYVMETLPEIIDCRAWAERMKETAGTYEGIGLLRGRIKEVEHIPKYLIIDGIRYPYENTAFAADLPAITEWMFFRRVMSNQLDINYAFRLYNGKGQEIARSPVTMMRIGSPYPSVQCSYICFDPLLDDEGQLALAEKLFDTFFYDRAGRSYHYGFFYIPAEWTDENGVVYGGDSGDSYGEVTGIVDGNRIYPQRLVYMICGETFEVFESDHEMFQGAELSTVRFESAYTDSILGTYAPDWERRLRQFRQAEALLDEQLPTTPISYLEPTQEEGNNYKVSVNRYDDPRIFACAYVWDNWQLATHGLLRTCCETFLCALLLAALVSWWLSLSLSGPLAALTCSVEAGADQYDQTTSVAEVNTLAAAFQTAQETLKEDLAREQTLTRAMAHELKTPLGVIRSYAEALEEDISPEKRGHYLTVLQQETDRMNSLVLRLLELSRLERGGELEKAPVDLAQLARERAARLTPALEERGLTLAQALEPMTVLGDSTLLGQAAENFLTNALRHTPAGGYIWLTVERVEDMARLTVENQGDPIPEEDLPRLWDTFFKGDKARTRDAGGAGLGLAIVRQIVLLHGGRYGAENAGGTVRVWFEVPQ